MRGPPRKEHFDHDLAEGIASVPAVGLIVGKGRLPTYAAGQGLAGQFLNQLQNDAAAHEREFVVIQQRTSETAATTRGNQFPRKGDARIGDAVRKSRDHNAVDRSPSNEEALELGGYVLGKSDRARVERCAFFEVAKLAPQGPWSERRLTAGVLAGWVGWEPRPIRPRVQRVWSRRRS